MIPVSTSVTIMHSFTYVPALDGLRALAALSVLGFHLRLPGFSGGALGVDMFFVLSGYLISLLILREVASDGRLAFRSFYLRRALRLFPAYITVLLLSVLADLLLIDVGGTLKGAFFSFFYIANWAIIKGKGLGSLHHTWSLSVEEQFYLIWPALLVVAILLARHTRIKLLLTVCVLCCTAWIIAAIAVFVTGVNSNVLNNATHFRATELLSGCVLAVVVSKWSRPAPGKWITLIGLMSLAGLIGLVVWGAPTSNEVLFATWALITLCTVGVIVAALAPTALSSSILSMPAIVITGKMSYGLYLWHFPVVTSVDTLMGLDSLRAKALAVFITAIVVPASYYFIEQPFLRRKAALAVTPDLKPISAAV